MTTFSTLFDTRGKRHLFSELTKASLENTAVEEKLVQTADMSTTVANGEEMRRRGVCVCVWLNWTNNNNPSSLLYSHHKCFWDLEANSAVKSLTLCAF